MTPKIWRKGHCDPYILNPVRNIASHILKNSLSRFKLILQMIPGLQKALILKHAGRRDSPAGWFLSSIEAPPPIWAQNKVGGGGEDIELK